MNEKQRQRDDELMKLKECQEFIADYNSFSESINSQEEADISAEQRKQYWECRKAIPVIEEKIENLTIAIGDEFLLEDFISGAIA